SFAVERMADQSGHHVRTVRPFGHYGEQTLNTGVIHMAKLRKVEIFSAGCALCEDTIRLRHRVAGPSRENEGVDMREKKIAARAKRLGIRSVPAVVIDGKLANCCERSGPDEATLRTALI